MNQQILIVDDSLSIREYMSHALSELGAPRVETTENAFIGIKRVHQNPRRYKAIFIDLNMPGMDGIELLRLLANSPYQGCVIVISQLDSKILELAMTTAKEHKLLLLGAMKKPLLRDDLARMLLRINSVNPFSGRPAERIKKRELQEAISESRVLPYFQPKVNIHSGRVIGFEALLRIDQPDQGVMPPLSILPTAEKFQLSKLLARKMIQASMADFKQLCVQAQCDEYSLSINMSPLELFDSNAVSFLANTADHYGIERQRILIEITENHVLSTVHQLETLNRFCVNGFRLSLDDFGTGFTNFQQLMELPFSEIKLDRLFVHGCYTDDVSKVIIHSVQSIAQKNNIHLLAEGIEHQDDLSYLVDAGVHDFQGFLFCRPKPLVEINRWLQQWHKVNPSLLTHATLPLAELSTPSSDYPHYH